MDKSIENSDDSDWVIINNGSCDDKEINSKVKVRQATMSDIETKADEFSESVDNSSTTVENSSTNCSQNIQSPVVTRLGMFSKDSKHQIVTNKSTNDYRELFFVKLYGALQTKILNPGKQSKIFRLLSNNLLFISMVSVSVLLDYVKVDNIWKSNKEFINSPSTLWKGNKEFINSPSTLWKGNGFKISNANGLSIEWG